MAGLLIIVAAVRFAWADDTERARRDILRALDDGRFTDAESVARTFFATLGGLAGADQPAVLTAADLWIEALIADGRGSDQQSQPLAREILRRRQATSRDRRELATAQGHLGAILLQSGDYKLAVAELDKARRLREETSVADDAAAVSDLVRLVDALLKISRYDAALAASQRAVDIARTLVNDRRSLERALNARGSVWQWKSELPRARADLESAHALEALDLREHPAVATTLTLLGTQSILEGDAVGARDILQRAVSVAQLTLRAAHPDVAWSMRVLAIPVQDLGDVARARALLERALALTLESVGPEHPLAASALQDLAGIFLAQADYEGARSRFEAALHIYERRFDRDYSSTATVAHNLASLYAKLGDFTRADAMHQRAIASWERALGSGNTIVARGLWEFGQTLAEQHLDAEAVGLFTRALEIRQRRLGPEHVDVAETLSSLAGSLASLGQQRRALTVSNRAMAIWNKAPTPNAEGYARSLLVHGAVLTASSDPSAAIEAYDRAMRVLLPSLGPSHPEIAQINVLRAALLARADTRDESLTLALRAEDIGRQHLSLTLSSLPERQALEYAAKRPQGLGLALSLVTPDRAAMVLDAVVRGRSLVLDEIALRRRAASNETSGSAAAAWTALRLARERLANLVIRGPGQQRPQQYAALVADAQQAKEDAERALAEQSAAFRHDVERAAVGLDQIRARLPAGSALVSIVRYDRQTFGPANQSVPSYAAFVLHADSREPAFVTLGTATTIETLVARWRQAMIADLATHSDAATAESFASLGVALRRRLWDPIAARIGEATRVFVVPDGAFNLAPLSALPSGRGRYQIEDGPLIHYLSAERDLVVDEPSATPSSDGLLAVGGAAFSDASSFAAARRSAPATAQGETLRSASQRSAAIDCGSFRMMRFDALPGTQNEARVVSGLWRQFEAGGASAALQTLTGMDATERAFKQLAPGHRILHVATHGFFLGDDCSTAVQGTRSVGGLTTGSNPAPAAPLVKSAARAVPENPLLLSGLALAGANRRAAAAADEDDGILTAEEVASLNLEGVQWAVLSACDTGLGTVIAREGVLGLRRAFQVAGVRTVIMSLWPVDDRATLEWMRRLYEARLGRHLGTAEAVQEASVRALRERRASHRSTNPFYWAAFVASGDWR